jgi:hypothetical protein
VVLHAASNALAMLGALREVENADLRMSRRCRVLRYRGIDPLSFAGLSVGKHSSEPNSDFGQGRGAFWALGWLCGMSKGQEKPQDKKIQDEWACIGLASLGPCGRRT